MTAEVLTVVLLQLHYANYKEEEINGDQVLDIKQEALDKDVHDIDKDDVVKVELQHNTRCYISGSLNKVDNATIGGENILGLDHRLL